LNKQDSIANKPLAPEAENLASEYATVFAESLFYHARALAHERGEEMVLTTHIKEALQIIRRQPVRKRWREAAAVLGSTFFGTAIAVFITEGLGLTRTPPVANNTALMVSFVVAIVTLLVTVVAILRE
jgi:hypothetical protein